MSSARIGARLHLMKLFNTKKGQHLAPNHVSNCLWFINLYLHADPAILQLNLVRVVTADGMVSRRQDINRHRF